MQTESYQRSVIGSEKKIFSKDKGDDFHCIQVGLAVHLDGYIEGYIFTRGPRASIPSS